MKLELDLARDSGAVPMEPHFPTTAMRRAIREITDAAIHEGLLLNDLPGLSSTLTTAMLAVAEGLVHHNQNPTVENFVEAVQALLEEARTVIDRGLLLSDWPQVLRGAVMLEVVARGATTCVGIPYEDVLREIHRANCAGESADVVGVLKRAGLIFNLQPRDEAPDEAKNP